MSATDPTLSPFPSSIAAEDWSDSLTSALAGFILVWYFVMWAISGLGLSVAFVHFFLSFLFNSIVLSFDLLKEDDLFPDLSSLNRYRPRPVHPPLTQSSLKPGVSVLRPLKGLDPNLYENLLSSFTQDYPGPFELIFSVADENDRALGVVRELIDRFGRRSGREDGVDVRVVVGSSPFFCLQLVWIGALFFDFRSGSHCSLKRAQTLLQRPR